MLLTHPERLQNYGDLGIDASGDEYSWYADGVFLFAPTFYFDDGKVKFHAHWYTDARKDYGSASGFLPAGTR